MKRIVVLVSVLSSIFSATASADIRPSKAGTGKEMIPTWIIGIPVFIAIVLFGVWIVRRRAKTKKQDKPPFAAELPTYPRES